MQNLQNNHGLPTGFAAQGSRTRGTGYPEPVWPARRWQGHRSSQQLPGTRYQIHAGPCVDRRSLLSVTQRGCPPFYCSCLPTRRPVGSGGGAAAVGDQLRLGQTSGGGRGGSCDGGSAAAGDQPPPPSSLTLAARPVPFGTFNRGK